MNSIFNNKKIFVLPEAQNQLEHLKGSNKKNILILFQEPPELNQQLIGYLGKILNAVKVNLLEDTLSVNLWNDLKVDFAKINTIHSFKYVIIFGSLNKQAGINVRFTNYQPTLLADIHFLLCDDLKSIYEERTQKNRPKATALWQSLKAMF